MFCSNCGMEVPDGANVCPNCGQQMQQEANNGFTQNAQQAFNQAEKELRVNSKVWVTL